jgi:hypothetical protein
MLNPVSLTVVRINVEPGTFTIPKEPVRRRVHGLQTFNLLRGGEYRFMPSLRALKWLAELTIDTTHLPKEGRWC